MTLYCHLLQLHYFMPTHLLKNYNLFYRNLIYIINFIFRKLISLYIKFFMIIITIKPVKLQFLYIIIIDNLKL
jgi:hypothetical protein